MRRLALLLTVSIPLCAVAVADAKSERRCGNVQSELVDAPRDVRALNTTCRRAKELAANHSRNSGRNDRCALAKTSCTLEGYRCRRGPIGDSTRITCTKGDKRVRWHYRS